MNQVMPHPQPQQPDYREIANWQSQELAHYRAQPAYPSYEPPEDAQQGFDFHRYLAIFLKHKGLILASCIGILMLSIAFTFLMTPIFRATTSIQIDRQSMEVVDVKQLQPDEGGAQGVEFYQTQYELLASRALAERVVSTLGLAEDANYNVETKSLIETVREMIVGTEEGTGLVEESPSDKQRLVVDKILEKQLRVQPVRNSRIVKISIDHPNSAVAQRVANGYADAFISDSLDRRYNATSYARKFLEEKLQQLKLKLEDSEKQLVKYAEEQGIISLNNDKNLSAADLEKLNDKLAEARSERIKKELAWKQAQKSTGFGLKDILDSKAVQENRRLRSELAAKYQQKLAIYKPAYPEMIELRNQIKELDRSVQTEVEAIKNSIEAEFLAAREEEDTLTVQLETSKAEVVDQRNRSIDYNIIQREVDTNRQLYDGLLQRFKEIGLTGGVGTNNVSIVDKATIPLLPVSPDLVFNAGLGALAGLILGLLLALWFDYLDDTYKSPEDVEREMGVSVIGVIPKPKDGVDVDQELLNARSGMSEAIRSLRTGLQFATSDGLPRTIVVTSSKPAEGKTTTTISLARSLAQIGLNVLLIDGDLRNASVHKRLRCPNEVGLSNLLTASRSPDECVQMTDTEGLMVMTAGPLPPNPAELLSGTRMSELLAMAQQSFNVVLVDGPPVMGLADAPLLSSATQATILVIAANETRKGIVKVAHRRLILARANVIGALLTKFDSAQVGYGYGYGEYEYYSYGTKELPAPKV